MRCAGTSPGARYTDALNGGLRAARLEEAIVAVRVDEALVRHVAMLSRLELTDEEVALFTRQLRSILEYVETLNRLDTDGVEPLAHPLPVVNVWREDEPAAPLPAEVALMNAPEREQSFFRVPRVLETETGA